LLEAIRANKLEILAAIQTDIPLLCGICEQSELSPKSSEAEQVIPPLDLPLPNDMPTVALQQQNRLIGFVMAQGMPSIGWCLARANAYFERFSRSTHEEQDAAAASDLLQWQQLGGG
jgi:hypothetical protein